MKNFKKLIAVILAVLMVAAIPMTAFAAPYTGTPIGNQGEQDAYVLDAVYLADWYYSHEDPKWEYDANYRYTDENGTVWRYYAEKNWIVPAGNDDWIYYVMEDGDLYVADNPDKPNEETNLVIPSSIDGKTVTRVLDAGEQNTLSIELPDTMTAIDHKAFRNKRSLKRVIIPTSVTSISNIAFELTDDVELYYCGTEEQWNNIIVWHHSSFHDAVHWAVTGFDWLKMPYDHGVIEETDVSAIYFNVNPDELEPLVPGEEDEPVEPTLFDKLVSGITGIIATITGFFKGIADFFGSIF